jgi:membrane-associated phospholipid phosphatase
MPCQRQDREWYGVSLAYGGAMPNWSLRRNRMLAMLVILPVVSLSYGAVAYLGATRAATGHLDLPWDHAIPLIAPMLIVYLTLGVFTLLLGWSADADAFMHCLRAALVTMASAYVGFLLHPLSVQRGPLPTDQPWHWCYDLLRAIDPPWNSFPSLHVAYAVLVWLAIPTRWGSSLWCLAIIASTLLTHQHLLCDVAGGMLLAAIAWRVADATWYRRLLPAHLAP